MPSPSSASENAQADERVDTTDATRHKRLARRRRDVPWPRKAHINCPCCRRCGVRGSLPPPRRDLLLSHMVLFFLRRCPFHLKEGAGGVGFDMDRPASASPGASTWKCAKTGKGKAKTDLCSLFANITAATVGDRRGGKPGSSSNPSVPSSARHHFHAAHRGK